MPDSMIDRVARAICDTIPLDSGILEYEPKDVMGVARAVLTAMREPTEAMAREAVSAPNYLEDQTSARGFTNMWHAAIDAALAE